MSSVGVDEEPLHELWLNTEYEVFVRYMNDSRDGGLHLSIKRYDRQPPRDWRHLQSIKNEIAGPEREALELFPRESRLVDQANQTHLWVLGAGVMLPVGFPERYVTTEAQGRAMHPDAAKARQRPWEPGLSTGPDYGRD